MDKRVKTGATLHRAAVFEAGTADTDKRTVTLAFSSDIAARRSSFFDDDFFEVLDHAQGAVRLDRLNNGAPLLIDHDNSIRSQPGVVESAGIGPDLVGRAVVRFGRSAADDEIFQKVQDGILRNVSVGYRVHNAVIDGQRDGLDVVRVTDWEPLEISLVPVPLDASVGVGRALDAKCDLLIKEDIKMRDENTDERVAAPSVDVEAMRQAEQDAARKAEQKRAASIMDLGKQYQERSGISLAAESIAAGHTVEEFQRVLLEALKKPVVEDPKPQGSGNSFDTGARVEDNQDKDGTGGFRNIGDFCNSVMNVCRNSGYDERLNSRAAASNITTSQAGPEGGYLIPTTFGQNIVELALQEQSLLSMIDNMPVEGNAMTLPADEGTPWGTTGIQANWEGEKAVAAQTKNTELEQKELKLKKLRVLVPVTDELLADATAMSSHITRKMSTRLDWKVQDAIVNGSGAGQPLGITQSGAIVSQAKETSQAADTIVAGNVAKMDGRLIEGAGARAVWLINPDAYNQLITLNSGGNLVWTPPNSGFTGAPGGFLLGKPVLKTDTCQTLGDKYDIILANMAGYVGITKAGGAEMATSMHLWFDQGLQAFRLTFRMDGQPVLSAPVTPPNSAIKRSHFVTLDART